MQTVRVCFEFALGFDALKHWSTSSSEAMSACAVDAKYLKNFGQKSETDEALLTLWAIFCDPSRMKLSKHFFEGSSNLHLHLQECHSGWSTVNF